MLGRVGDGAVVVDLLGQQKLNTGNDDGKDRCGGCSGQAKLRHGEERRKKNRKQGQGLTSETDDDKPAEALGQGSRGSEERATAVVQAPIERLVSAQTFVEKNAVKHSNKGEGSRSPASCSRERRLTRKETSTVTCRPCRWRRACIRTCPRDPILHCTPRSTLLVLLD